MLILSFATLIPVVHIRATLLGNIKFLLKQF
uniref:Uncharacterized protein n=1 Tax=Populus trichocarpa TaxID=3694 RepID=A0A3N7G7X9_POPTR